VDFCAIAWTREQLKIGLQTSNARRQNPVKLSPVARSHLTRLPLDFSVRQPLRRRYLKFGSNDMRLPVR